MARATLPGEPGLTRQVCGPEIVTIGDAWEAAQRHLRDAQQMMVSQDLAHIPQKVAAVAAHLRFMQGGAVMLYGKHRRQLDKGISAIDFLSAELRERTLQGQVPDYAALTTELAASAKFIGAQFPEEALLPSVSFAHLLPPERPILHIQLNPLAVVPGQPVRVVFQMVELKGLKPVGLDDIVSSHGAALHALVCDRTLTDYHHQHPQPTGKPGEWEFTFTPTFGDQYRLWINLIPKLTGREEFPVNTVVLADPLAFPPPPVFMPTLEARSDGIRARITWDAADKLEAKRPVRGTLHVTDDAGQPVQDLEPYMEDAAHIVGISTDLLTVLHAHAMKTDAGELPTGPEFRFTMMPPEPGFYRLFVQVKRRGQIHSLPFGVQIGQLRQN